MTALDIIKGSLRLIGAIAGGETPSASESADAFSSLNDMIDAWSNDGLMIYQNARESFALTPSQQVYTIGTGGNFNTSRPTKLIGAGIEQISGSLTNEIPLKIITIEEWSEIGVKSTPSPLPSKLYIEDQYPLAKITLWPVPSDASNLILYSVKPLSTFALSSDVISLPPGYARALRYNLAIELATEYGKAINPVTEQIAMDSKNSLMRVNTNPSFMKSDALFITSGKPFNWLTGE